MQHILFNNAIACALICYIETVWCAVLALMFQRTTTTHTHIHTLLIPRSPRYENVCCRPGAQDPLATHMCIPTYIHHIHGEDHHFTYVKRTHTQVAERPTKNALKTQTVLPFQYSFENSDCSTERQRGGGTHSVHFYGGSENHLQTYSTLI